MRDAKLEAASREAHQVGVRVDEAREDGSPAQIDDPFPDSRGDVAAPACERDAPVADDDGVNGGEARVQDVDTAVRQQHGDHGF